MSALNLIHSLEMQQHLKDAYACDARLIQQLEQAHQRDVQALQGHLEDLVGGQAELQRQLNAATEEQRQAWFDVADLLSRLAGDVGVIKEGVGVMRLDVGVIRGDVGVIRDDVMELAAAVRAWMEGCTQAQAGSSRQLVHSRLMLDRKRVQWDEGTLLDSGGFANVYAGTFSKRAVAVKLLRLSAFTDEQQREQVRTASVATEAWSHLDMHEHCYGMQLS